MIMYNTCWFRYKQNEKHTVLTLWLRICTEHPVASELNSDTEREEQINRQVHQASDVAEQPMSEDTVGEREDKTTDAVRVYSQEYYQQSSLVKKVDDCAHATKKSACRFYVRFYFTSEKMHTTLELMLCWIYADHC